MRQLSSLSFKLILKFEVSFNFSLTVKDIIFNTNGWVPYIMQRLGSTLFSVCKRRLSWRSPQCLHLSIFCNVQLNNLRDIDM